LRIKKRNKIVRVVGNREKRITGIENSKITIYYPTTAPKT